MKDSPVATQSWAGREHVLDLDDFSRAELEDVLETANHMQEILSRSIPRVPTLRGRTMVNLFYEPSTRTRASFELAAKVLGADVLNVTAGGSSVEKGETLLDTVRTLRALGAGAVVIRHGAAGAPYLVARECGVPTINAGDGCHGHPTQALLDAYTIHSHFGHIDRLRVVVVGDIAHSRVARSDAWGLTKLGAQVIFCGPPALLPPSCLVDGEAKPWPVEVELDLDRAIADVDVVMPLRIQWERQEGNSLSSLREYAREYGITRQRLKRAAPHAIVMHPGPMNEGVEIEAEVAHGENSVIEEQVTNGVAVRMAVLYLLMAAAEGRGSQGTVARKGGAA